MYAFSMATKTISLDLVAYESLCRLRREPRESFSKVIRRVAETLGARSPVAAPAAAAATAAVGSAPTRPVLASLFSEADRLWLPPDEALDRLDRHQASPRPRRDPRRESREDSGHPGGTEIDA